MGSLPTEQSVLLHAVSVLRGGHVVAFPTETVYGLGADATNAEAVHRIFAAKGRPSTNPLIVHVSDSHIAKRYAKHWPPAAEALARRFWPGPLTLVVPKGDAIVPEVTAGRETVGIRAPDHPVALELLRAFDGPVAAPSANRSNRVSPTTAGHVRRDLGDRVDLILDGGPCRVGIESTVLDLTGLRPVILRPGAVTREQIEAVVGPVEVFQGHMHASDAAHSPGQQVIHYSPRTAAYRFPTGDAALVRRWMDQHADERAIVLLPGSRELSDVDDVASPRVQTVEMPADAEGYARELYAALHEADDSGVSAIFVQMPPDAPQWAAVRDRLMRATRPIDG
ncbi:MAG TPA: L-threonylcarbamoyladenylate synthase [Tepidisphaeraceae bacterium]|jgi:L-threonylcarbamoyladenylate synthase